MKTRYCFSLTKILLLGSSLFLVACDNNSKNTDIKTEEGLLNVQSEFDDSSGLVSGLDDTATGPSAVDGLDEAQITEAQEQLDAIDAPDAIAVEN
ncbi:MAG: hypothetical protein PSN04_10225 [Methyloprofundus sp.]|nr:hypothetical protein [Methyloprofundus sp.]